uniref:NADH-ubiquinone oxidoreductase chain 6 n=1 Tax=Orithyia sinica TaxID=260260 RepID=A0A346RN76_9EUCA|nr:NADH dehydrogenase subunit 6 [Orithyia sinica]AXS67523.1 NADH dehydrogenase subunit 6 [Orithyia sinica]
MTLLMIPLILMLSLLFTRLTHPLSMGLTLLSQTTMIALSAGIPMLSFWFSYILFLIFLGGMLVLFIYVASLASNESFHFSVNIFFTYATLLAMMMLTLLLLDPLTTMNSTSLPISSFSSNLTTPSMISWIYNTPSMMFTVYIILYLLLTLIVVVKITNLLKGPLRLMN